MASSNEWDKRYREREWSTEPDEFLVSLTSPLPPSKAIDLGSGTGRNAIWLAQHGWEVVAVDSSEVGLALLAERAGSLGVSVRTICTDLLDASEPEGSFDLVVLANIHPQPELRPQVFAAASRLLRAGGHLFFVGHHIEALGKAGPPDPNLLYTEEAIRSAMPTDLVIRREHTYHRESDNPDHGGDVGVMVWAEKTA